jgi:hypothetical protein
MRPRLRRLHGGLCVALVLGVLLAGSAPGAAQAGPGVEILEAARQRAASIDYSGVVHIEWYDGTQALSARVLVRQEGDVLEAGSESLVDGPGPAAGAREDAAWTFGSRDPSVHDGPSPGEKYRIRVGARLALGGRSAQLLEARRRADGTVAQRMLIDDATGLVVEREIYERDGSLVQSMAFERLWKDPDAVVLVEADGAAPVVGGDAAAEVVGDLRAPLRDPASVGDGFALVGRWTRPDGVSHLLYSDGLFGVSVFEQAGRLDWGALPAGGQGTSIGGLPALRYSLPMGPAVIWERDGVVFTLVGAAATDELAAIGADVSSPPAGNAIVRFARFALDPFRM